MGLNYIVGRNKFRTLTYYRLLTRVDVGSTQNWTRQHLNIVFKSDMPTSDATKMNLCILESLDKRSDASSDNI